MGAILLSLVISLIYMVLPVNGQTKPPEKKIRFIAPLPKGQVYLKPDVVKLPLDDYVNIKGAKFTVNTNDPKNIEPNVALVKKQTLPSGLLTNCDQLIRAKPGVMVMVCNERYFVKMDIDLS